MKEFEVRFPKYTSDGSVINSLDGLKEQLKKNDAGNNFLLYRGNM